jgi:hypothetical protein
MSVSVRMILNLKFLRVNFRAKWTGLISLWTMHFCAQSNLDAFRMIPTQELVGRTNHQLVFILHGLHRKDVAKYSVVDVCIRCRGNFFTEPLRSNYKVMCM